MPVYVVREHAFSKAVLLALLGGTYFMHADSGNAVVEKKKSAVTKSYQPC